MMQNQVDIDQLIKEVKNWDIHTEKLVQENEELRKQILFLEKRCELNNNGEAQSKDEADQLRKITAIMQETIEKQCNIEEENHNNKKAIKKLKENETYLQNLAQMKEEEMKEKMEVLKELNTKEIMKIKKQFEEKIDKIKKDYQSAAEERSKLIEDSRKQVADVEREKQREIMMLRLEYDEKIQRLQKQSVSSSQANNGSSSSLKNEILRKKLQHVQMEAGKEIAALKNRIAELERGPIKQQIQKKRKLSFQ
eukprot:gene7443-8265_t